MDFVDTHAEIFKDKDKAWYMQFSAQLLYLNNPAKANDLQIKAGELATGMFHPPHGPIYTKLTRSGEQAAIVRRNIAEYERPQDIFVFLDTLLESLQYNPEIDSEKFHEKLAELGRFLGFSAQEPEKELGAGPDVLWCMTDGLYLILEAKSRTQGRRISRGDMEQLYHSERWFKRTYGEASNYLLVTLQKSKDRERDAEVDSRTFVLCQDSLDELKNNLRQFVTSLTTKQTDAHTEREIAELLRYHKFDPESFRTTFLKRIK